MSDWSALGKLSKLRKLALTEFLVLRNVLRVNTSFLSSLLDLEFFRFEGMTMSELSPLTSSRLRSLVVTGDLPEDRLVLAQLGSLQSLTMNGTVIKEPDVMKRSGISLS